MSESVCRECGFAYPVRVSDVLRGRGRYCSRRCANIGCGRQLAAIARRHGFAGHDRPPEYKVWTDMRGRCKRHPKYAGRGIILCARWADSFSDFYSDMGPRPSPGHWIERIDNDGNYEPSNCRWATIKEQTRNRRTTRYLIIDGMKRCLSEWAEVVGLSTWTIRARIDRLGWTPERAVFTPPRGAVR